jgi:hypothetical protein
MIMRTQVEVLRLEKALSTEREKLGHLRKQLSHLVSDEDGAAGSRSSTM